MEQMLADLERTQKLDDIQIVETQAAFKAESVDILQETKLAESRSLIHAISIKNAVALEIAARMVDLNWSDAARGTVVGDTPQTLRTGDLPYTRKEQHGNRTDYIKVSDPEASVVTLDFSGARGPIGKAMHTTKRLEASYLGRLADGATIERKIEAEDGRVFVEVRTVKPAEPDSKTVVSVTKWFHDNEPADKKYAWMEDDVWDLRVSTGEANSLETYLTINKTNRTIKVMPSSGDKGYYHYPNREAVTGAMEQLPKIVALEGNFALRLGGFSNQLPPKITPVLPVGVTFK